ncbi:hypothetical protein WIS52_21705 [Pseudonocardia nematodicida]|uniref:Integral membrane protein n=1 Tax=Pseudonocardia nematodicida TaxID=1206997 RepID=A0ABV1KF54_9PSEU
MRVAGMTAGLLGAVVAVALMGAGTERVRRGAALLDHSYLYPGAALMLAGGAVVGVLAAQAGRSPATPATAGTVFLLGSLYALVDPNSAYRMMGPGIGDLLLLQFGTVLGAVLLVAAVRRRRAPAVSGRPSPRTAPPSPGSGPVVH